MGNSDSIRVMSTSNEDMREVYPGQVYMKHMYGTDVSVALFRFIAKKGEPFPVPAHKHGEEIAFVIKGRIILNGVTAGPGDLLIVPPGIEHSAACLDLEDGEELIVLSIITPPRREYGPEGSHTNPWTKKS